jgi:glucosamine 6-phosphate synthetase-like amidotransferase/phosphosugar isomerase protein
LLQLERQLTGGPVQLAETVVRAADAVEHLLGEDEWLARASDVLDGPHGTWIIGSAERMGNALQGALMLREGPRRVADGCETGDWSHVDVYLTKTKDYRALLFPGSRHDGSATQWMRDRGSRFVVVGQPSEATTGAEVVVRYPHDDDPLVALLVEVLAPELLSARWWSAD